MIIKKNTHAPLRLPKLLINPKVLEYNVTFTDSCRYDIGEDQTDINKLFGIGYFPFHHWNSVRIGWAYNPTTDKIDISAYWYEKGQRKWQETVRKNIGEEINFKIEIGKHNHYISINNSYATIPLPGQRLGYLLRPYFGGNRKAPHDIEIKGI